MPTNELHSEWGRRLATAREALGLSISELARRTEIHKSHLARFELGEAGLGDEYRIRVAAEVGQRVESLFPYPDTTQDDPCPSAASAPGEAACRTRATEAATRSPAPSAPAQAGSAPEGSRVHE
jgi:transcriptional regulator with XRE-family HTH domain